MKPEKLIQDAAKQALWDAADYIEEHGHCQSGDIFGPDGSSCVIGALLGVFLSDRAPINLLAHAIADKDGMLTFHPELHPVAVWSDTTPTAEVLAKLREVALS
jgi:hypothetical protein